MKAEELVESLGEGGREVLLEALEGAELLGMNQVNLLLRRGSSRLVLSINMNPYTEEILSIVAIAPLGCGESQPSLEKANRAAAELGGALMAYGECSSLLVGYSHSEDLKAFIFRIFEKVYGEPGGPLAVEDYTHDLAILEPPDDPGNSHRLP